MKETEQINVVSAKPPVVLKKKKENIGTPSISQALSGSFTDTQVEKVVIPEYYTRDTKESDQNFSEELLLMTWPEFAEKYADQVHLYNTLSVKPVLLDNFKVKITVENSVQQDQIRILKPEIIGFLSRRLRNNKIDVVIVMQEGVHEEKMFTNDQKMQAMMKKNPVLKRMKNIFNLDFNG